MSTLSARARVERLLWAMRQVVEPGSARRSELCGRLCATTGLSPAGVEFALDHCLELTPSSAELDALCASVPTAARAHVILPANVFVAAHRAVALALASAPHVFVKASRREPALIEALAAQAPELFHSVTSLAVQPRDHVWAYGSDVTLQQLRSELPQGAFLHAHGTGFGAALIDLGSAAGPEPALGALAAAIARDTAAFDQRGCLSPRLVLALGERARAPGFAELLAQALSDAERRQPRGRLDPDELADARWYVECSACFGRVLPAGRGQVSLRLDPATALGHQSSAALDIPPIGRHLEVVSIDRLEPALSELAPWLTALGCAGPELERRARQLLPKARVGPLGRMQSPPFDGPVDLRPDAAGELIV
jgi:acyl-CoA reductase LuxC